MSLFHFVYKDNINLCVFVFCITVTAPAGFPDHPHRGFHHFFMALFSYFIFETNMVESATDTRLKF